MLEALRRVADDLVRDAADVHPALEYREIVIGFRSPPPVIARHTKAKGLAAATQPVVIPGLSRPLPHAGIDRRRGSARSAVKPGAYQAPRRRAAGAGGITGGPAVRRM